MPDSNNFFISIKRAFIYLFLVAVITLSVIALDYLNETLLAGYPSFPIWAMPLAFAVIVVSIGFFAQDKLRESGALKSEFMMVVTHKFRTSLTQIRWAVESLSKAFSVDDEDKVAEIERASGRLVTLTDLVTQFSDADAVEYNYHPKPIQFDALIGGMKAEYERRAGLKEISIAFSISSNRKVLADESQTRFVVQTLLDNAINYTPKGGHVDVELKEENPGKRRGKMIFSVRDSGIGMSKEELANIFQKFWRSSGARKADGEGMGVGLFTSHRIMERQGGSISVSSPGLGKGSVFSLKLPIAS